MSRCQTGFMDGDRCHGWHSFVVSGALEKWPINLKELSNDSGSNPDHDLSGANDIQPADRLLVGRIRVCLSSIMLGRLTRIARGVD